MFIGSRERSSSMASRINIAFAIDENFVDQLNIAIYSLLKNNQDSKFDINIINAGLTERSQSSIKEILKHYKNSKISFINIQDQKHLFSDLPLTVSHISRATYYRFLLAELFPKLDKILWLDADILVTNKIDKLWETDIEKVYAAGVDAPGIKNNFSEYKKEIGFDIDELHVNAGILLLNLGKIRRDNKTKELFDNTIKLKDKIRFQDQCIINITFQGKMKELGDEYNYTDYAQMRDKDSRIKEVAIVHYTGARKPWCQYDPNDKYNVLYFKYIDEYNELIYKSKDKFALYKYRTSNIGDDIQSLAARRFLPRVDYFINRDEVGQWENPNSKEKVKLVANGWYMHYPFAWPIQDKTIEPLLTSIHFTPTHVTSEGSAKERFLSDEAKRFYKKHGSIGSRDRFTEKLFKDSEIDTYFSGCLTLTLQRDERVKKQDFILVVDTSRELFEYVRSKTNRKVVYLTTSVDVNLPTQERFREAELYLYLYQAAHCVITTRLHTALPSLALESPVMLVSTEKTIDGKIRNRFAGLENLTRLHTEEAYFKDYSLFDVDNPPQNSTKYQAVRNRLIKLGSEFTGFNNDKSFAWTDVPKENTDDVLAEVHYRKMSELCFIAWDTRRVEGLFRAIDKKELEIKNNRIEIAQMMTIKASARRLAGNVKRKTSRIFDNVRSKYEKE